MTDCRADQRDRWTWLRVLLAIGIAAGAQGCAELTAIVSATSNLGTTPKIGARADGQAPATSEKTASAKEAQRTVVPIPLSDPTIGSGLTVLGMYFHPQSADEAAVQPPSLTAAFAMALGLSIAIPGPLLVGEG